MPLTNVNKIYKDLTQLQVDPNLIAMTQACRASNLTALDCAPELYQLFPTTSASDLGAALVTTWGCELSAANLTTALNSCLKSDSSPAYTTAQVAQSISDNLSLNHLDSANVPTTYGPAINNQLKMIGLAQGSLVTIKPAESAQFLIISCLPGDYSPTPGSMIAALKTAYGLDVAAMAQNKAADYLQTDSCWFSQNLSQYAANIPYQQLLVFETTGADAIAKIPGIFSAIQFYVPNPPAIPDTGATIVSALVSTGSAGADPAGVLTQLFNSCWSLMTNGSGYNMTCFKIVSYPASWSSSLTTTFDLLKSQHSA